MKKIVDFFDIGLSSSSSLSVPSLENSVDIIKRLIKWIVLLIILWTNASGIKRNSKGMSWKKRRSVPWGSRQNSRTSDILWPSSWLFYCTSLGGLPIFPIRAAPEAHIPSCSKTALCTYSSSIRFCHCASASSVLLLISLAAHCSFSSTLS